MNQFNSIYDFTSHDGLISRKLNEQKWKDLQQSPQFAQMKEAGEHGYLHSLYTDHSSAPPGKKGG